MPPYVWFWLQVVCLVMIVYTVWKRPAPKTSKDAEAKPLLPHKSQEAQKPPEPHKSQEEG